MLAIDTNILVRALTMDNAIQAQRVEALLGGDEILFVSTSVLLETAWVLKSVYGFGKTIIIAGLRMIAGRPNIVAEQPSQLASALDLADQGMDIADAFHLAAASGCEGFATFDRALIKIAATLGTVPVREP